MRLTEIIRLVWLNLSSNKTKVILTSTGIIVGAATIMLVLAIGTGGREEVAEQFKNLNAGAIDISYEYQGRERSDGSFGGGSMGGAAMPIGGAMPSVSMSGGGMPMGGSMPASDGFAAMQEGQGNNERITLSKDDLEDLETFVPGIDSGIMTFTTTTEVDGGELESSTSVTIAGVQSGYAAVSNLAMAMGEFLTEENDEYKDKVCVLGYSTAKTIYGSVYDAYDSKLYIDDRAYTVVGILDEVGSVASGISPDTAVFIPYNTGAKYLADGISPTITVIAEDVNQVDSVIEDIQDVLADSYPNAQFTITDAGSKMEAASKSNETLTMLLVCMAAIVFLVGGIGIMNVLIVSVKERTNEIGILKAIGCSKRDILLEFLLEASCISMVGAVFGVMLGLCITPVLEYCGARVELSLFGGILSLVFGVLTGSIFGFYPAYQAASMIPVEALNHE